MLAWNIKRLTVALAATNDAPRIVVDHREILLAARCEGVVEVVPEASWLLPGIFRIAQEHAQEMTSAGLAIGAPVCLTSMHDAQVVEKLNVALLAVKLCAKALCKFFDSIHSMQLLFGNTRHARVAVNQWRTHEWGLDKLAHGFAVGKEERWSVLKIWILVPGILSASRSIACNYIMAHFCFSSKGQFASAIVSRTSGSFSRSSL
jgi:hypothetical protein